MNNIITGVEFLSRKCIDVNTENINLIKDIVLDLTNVAQENIDNYALDCGYFSANIGVPAVILFPKERKILQFEAIEDCALIMKYLNQEYE